MVDLSNQTKTSTHKDVPLKIFLHLYYENDDDYIQDLKYFKIFRYKAWVHISQEKQVKFSKYISKIKKKILVSYKDINIF